MGYELTKITDFAQAGTYPSNLPFQKGIAPEPPQVWDGRGLKTQFTYDDSGSPSEVHYADQSTALYDRVHSSGSLSPDPARIHNSHHHWLFKKTDERNQVTTYARDERRRVTDIGYPDGSSEHFVYNEWNQVTSHTLPSGAIQTYEYDGLHRLIREYNSVDISISGLDYKYYTYYGQSNHPEWADLVATMTDGRARASNAPFTAKMTYNGRHEITSVEFPPAGGSQHPTVSYEYDKYGNCTAIIDELGHRKDYTYDSYRRCTSYTEQLNAPGWDGTGNVPSRRWDWIYDRVIDNIVGAQNTFGPSAHTSKEWRVQIEPAFNAAGERRMTARWFDVNNRIVLEQTGWIQRAAPAPLGDWYPSPTDIEAHYFTYDENGQKKSYKDPRGRISDYQYDDRNRLWKTTENPMPGSNGSPRTTETQYNTVGDKTKVIFPDGKIQEWPDYAYTAFGQPRLFIDERNNPTNMEYWLWGPMKKLARVTTHRSKDDNAGMEDQITDFSYDGMGRPWRTNFPDNTYEENTYKFGQLKTWKTRRNQVKTISYDVRGREFAHSWNDGRTPGVNRGWDDANRLVNISNSFSAINYGYDDASQMRWENNSITGTNTYKQVTYYRYPDGEVSRMVYPNGTTTVDRTYTARGQLQGVGWTGNLSASYAYLPDGKVDYQTCTGGVRTDYRYDGRGFIDSISHKNGNGQSLAYREYWRDNRDRITAWKRGPAGGPNGMEDGRGDRYSYDEEGQLEIADYRALTPETTPSDPKRRDHFHYDQLGNRMESNDVANRGTVNMVRRNNGLNQYLNWTPSAIYYDDNFGSGWTSPGNGVTMAEGYITASFNALNQPMAIWSPVYGSTNYMWFGFDPLGRCVKRWVGPDNPPGPPANTNPATYFYYDGWNLIQEGPSATIAERTYVHGGRVDEIVASQAGGVWSYHHYDARGHCIMLTNTSGGIREQYDYDAFGFPYFYNIAGTKLVSSLQSGNRFLFTGREWLNELRIYDFRNRMYQPELGRFLQPDPKEFAAGDYNLYRYCHNDPVNHVDPTGLTIVDFTKYEIHLGSWIPQAVTYSVNFTESGNHKNADPKSHHTDADLRKDGQRTAGLTQHQVTMTAPGKGSRVIGANLNIDWWVRRGAAERDPNLATLEAQHTPLLLKAWSEAQMGYGSFSTMLGGWYAKEHVGSDLRIWMDREAGAQARTMDCKDCAHDYKIPY